MKGDNLSLNGMRGNLNGNILIKANHLNLGSGALNFNGKESVFDVNDLTGTPGTCNSKLYLYAQFVNKYNNSNNINIYKNNGTIWNGFFKDQPDAEGYTINLAVRQLVNTNIDFKDVSINPTLDINKIHYFSGTSSNIITDNKLPNYKGDICSADTYKGGYEYIICHGPLLINTTDKNNGKFNFTGIIYCDNVVTFNDLDSNFNGIIIAAGMNALNVIGTQTHNWNVTFNNNSGNTNGITEIQVFNAILSKITISP